MENHYLLEDQEDLLQNKMRPQGKLLNQRLLPDCHLKKLWQKLQLQLEYPHHLVVLVVTHYQLQLVVMTLLVAP